LQRRYDNKAMDFKTIDEINQDIKDDKDIDLEKTVRELVTCHNGLNQSCMTLTKSCIVINQSCMDNFQKIASMLDKLEKRIDFLEKTVRQHDLEIYIT